MYRRISPSTRSALRDVQSAERRVARAELNSAVHRNRKADRELDRAVKALRKVEKVLGRERTLDTMALAWGKKHGVKGPVDQLRRRAQFRALMYDVEHGRSKKATSPKARALVQLGVRSADEQRPVGGSPKKRRR